MADGAGTPGDPTTELRRLVDDLHDHVARVEALAAGGGHALAGDARAVGDRLRSEKPHPGEQRWPVALAVSVAIALQVVLPDRLTFGPSYLLPVLEGALLVGLTAANPRRIDRTSRALRTASLALIALTSLANGWSSGELVAELIGGTAGKTAGPLLASGASIYLTNVIVFSLWYWEMDAGGPVARTRPGGAPPDFLFPQITQPGVAPDRWRPTYLDYVYTSYTNATAFSPTDVMPLTHRAKALMALQSAVALATVALVVARAVNVLS
ncbi:MAG TPA: hypothetical protein VFP61_02815 [Acidimicrobiales bacterium]|nr:hypothetical protein [Acidimicrobiales bacterium]